jgi:glycosyltransferase involved in cell wall biosynthesis
MISPTLRDFDTAATEALPSAQAGALRHCDGRQVTRFVVVHGGARDAYQLAQAFSDAGMLEVLVTDLFWPVDRGWAQVIGRIFPRRLRSLLLQRSEPDLPSRCVHLCVSVGLATLICDKIPKMPKSLRRRVTRYADAAMGRTAGKLAARSSAGLVSYSYYGFDAFTSYDRPATLFQMHPHPVSMRRILIQELEAHPECGESLKQEWELSLPDEDFAHLVRESAMASSYLVASSFTKQTLIENGIPGDSVAVIPYGVDTQRFVPDARRRSSPGSKLQLLFVGRINQRKGIKYLLEALSLLNSDQIELTVCGRVVDGLELFRPFGDQVIVRPSVSANELVVAYQAADLFVFPSVGEGFGQVLLEALACGLPVVSTTRTAAPDLIEDGVQGFVVEPRSAGQLADRIAWALDHRAELEAMGVAARIRSEQFTWQRFRSGVVSATLEFAGAARGRCHV